LLFWGNPRSGSEIVAAVHWNPGFHGFQVLKNHTAIGGQIANYGKFGKRLQANGLLEIVKQGRAGHASLPVDQHRARSTDFFEAI
jgi:hypothetical protein